MGRPTKLTPEVRKAISMAFSQGMTLKEAARAGGVHVSTVLRWLERGATGKGKMRRYAAFCASVNRAKKVAENLRLMRFYEREGWL